MNPTLRAGVIATLRSIAYILFAFIAASVVFQIAGYDSGMVLRGIADGSMLGTGAPEQTVRWMMPLLLVSLGGVVSFRAGYFNIGAQGQFYAGAITAAATVAAIPSGPRILVITLAVMAGAVGGLAWAAWPAILRVVWDTDEVITTLMGNFLATLLLSYVVSGPLKDQSGTGQASASNPVPAYLRIGSGFTISWTIVALAVAATIATWLLVNRTAFGLASGLVGRNPLMMMWQGARIRFIGVQAFLFSGALAGIAGATDVLGPTGRLVTGMDANIGFTGIIIALVGGLTVLGAVLGAFFFGALAASSLFLPIAAGLPAAAIDIINATVALLVTSTYSLRRPRKRLGRGAQERPIGSTAASPAAIRKEERQR